MKGIFHYENPRSRSNEFILPTQFHRQVFLEGVDRVLSEIITQGICHAFGSNLGEIISIIGENDRHVQFRLALPEHSHCPKHNSPEQHSRYY